jgi:hypothetical protein
MAEEATSALEALQLEGPMQGREPEVLDWEQYDKGKGINPAELVGKRLRGFWYTEEEDRVKLLVTDGSRYVARMEPEPSVYEVVMEGGYYMHFEDEPDDFCAEECAGAADAAPPIVDCQLLRCVDKACTIWDNRRWWDCSHICLGLKFEGNDTWYKIQCQV